MSRVVRLDDVLAAVDAAREEMMHAIAFSNEYPELKQHKWVLNAVDTAFIEFARALGPEGDHDE